MSVNAKMKKICDNIRSRTGGTALLTLDQIADAIMQIGEATDPAAIVYRAIGATYPPGQLPATPTLSGYDIDILNSTADGVYSYIDSVVSGKDTVIKEIMGKDASGKYDIARYVYANRERYAWAKENYPKMYAWKNGNAIKYTQSVSPRIDEKAYDTPYVETKTTQTTTIPARAAVYPGQRYSLSGGGFKAATGVAAVIIPLPLGSITEMTVALSGTKRHSTYTDTYGGAANNTFTASILKQDTVWNSALTTASYNSTNANFSGFNFIVIHVNYTTGTTNLGITLNGKTLDCVVGQPTDARQESTSTVEVEGDSGTPITAVSATRRSRTIGGAEYVRYEAGDVEPTVIYTDKGDSRNSNATITQDGITYHRYPLGDLGANRTKLIPVFIYANEHGYIPNHTYPGHETKMCALVAARFLRDLASGAQTENPLYKFIRENCMVVVIPVANPYGFNMNVTGDSNGDPSSGYMNANRCNINRNYDTPGWDYMYVNDPVNASWYGVYPGSQNETQYIMNTMVESGAAVAMSLHGHSGGANLSAIQGQDPDGTYFDEDKMAKISAFLQSNYGYKLVDYDVYIEVKYNEVGAHNMPDVTCKSPSYITQCGAYGGIVEFSPFEHNATSKVVTYSAAVIENAYAQVLNLIAMWLSDYLVQKA